MPNPSSSSSSAGIRTAAAIATNARIAATVGTPASTAFSATATAATAATATTATTATTARTATTATTATTAATAARCRGPRKPGFRCLPGVELLQALDTLKDAASSEEERVRALHRLGEHRGDEVRLAILEAMDATSQTLREAAVEAAFRPIRPDLHRHNRRPEGALQALHVAALTHGRSDVRAAALRCMPPATFSAIARPLLAAVAAGELERPQAERVLRQVAHDSLAELERLFVDAGEPDAERTRWAAAHIAWEQHYAATRPPRLGQKRFDMNPAEPPRSGSELAREATLHSPDSRTLWNAWIDAFLADHPAASLGLDHIAITMLALPQHAITAHLCADLLHVLRERLERSDVPRDRRYRLATLLAVLALREPAILVLRWLPGELRLETLRALHELYPDGPQERRTSVPADQDDSLRKLHGSTEQLIRHIMRVPMRSPGPERSPVAEGKLREEGLPLGPAATAITLEDLEEWLVPGPQPHASRSSDPSQCPKDDVLPKRMPESPRGAGNADPCDPPCTLLESWLTLFPASEHGALVWKHSRDEVLLALLERPAAAGLVEKLLAGEGGTARRLLSLRERARTTRASIAILSFAHLRSLLGCGHRDDIRAALRHCRDLDPLLRMLPALERVEFPRRRRPHLEFAGQRIAALLLTAPQNAQLRTLVRGFAPAEETWGVLFHTLETIARTQPQWLARILVEEVLPEATNAETLAAAWAGIDTLGPRFHRAVIERLQGAPLASYLSAREVRVAEEEGPLTLGETLYRIATGRTLPAARLRQGLPGWITLELLQQSPPAPQGDEERHRARGLLVALLAALRDRIDRNHPGLPTAGVAGLRLRHTVDHRINLLVRGDDAQDPEAREAEAGMVLMGAARWAAELGRVLGRGRRVRLLSAAAGGALPTSSQLRSLLLVAARESGSQAPMHRRVVLRAARRRMRRVSGQPGGRGAPHPAVKRGRYAARYGSAHPGHRETSILADALAALPMVALLEVTSRSGHGETSVLELAHRMHRDVPGGAVPDERRGRSAVLDPALAAHLLCEVGRGVLPGNASQRDRLLERLAELLPVSLRAAASACVPPALFWSWAQAPSPGERAHLLAHLNAAPLVRRGQLALALPWFGAELPEPEMVNALLGPERTDVFPDAAVTAGQATMETDHGSPDAGIQGDPRSVLAAIEEGLCALRALCFHEERPLPRLRACLQLIAALRVPIVRRRRWVLHLLRLDSAFLVSALLMPDAERFPTGITSLPTWQAERRKLFAELPELLELPEGIARRIVADMLFRCRSWAEWSALVEAWSGPACSLCRLSLLRSQWNARPTLIDPRRGLSGSRAAGRLQQAAEAQQRAHLNALRILCRGLQEASAGASVAAPIELPLAALLCGERWSVSDEAMALLADLLRSARGTGLDALVRLLGATLSPALAAPAVQDALVERAEECRDATRCRRLRRLARSVPDAEFQRRMTRALMPIEERRVVLRRLAELTRWTAELGQRLVGVPTRIRFIGGDTLGYTYLDGDTIWVNPAAWFQGAPDGRAVVEGLIAHEIGHLALHASREFRKCARSERLEGRHHWLNLVLDEHLERNLRARDAGLGERFHKLGVWALDRRAERVPAHEIVLRGGLRGVRGGIGAAHLDALPWEVRVHPRELPKPTAPAERFFRALRLGLGSRDADPLVQQGLGLFRASAFREAKAADLRWRSEELARLFPQRPGRPMDRVVAQRPLQGGEPEVSDPRDAMDLGGWTVVEIESAAAGGVAVSEGEGSGGIAVHNRRPDLCVHPFARVLVPPCDADAERRLRSQAGAFAGPVRAALARLGQRRVEERHLARGRRLDPAGLGQRVLCADPRLLRRHRSAGAGDLFIGVLVDSSGSMRMSQNIEKARLFGAITAVAAAGLPHVTTRVAGFTHDTLLDLGDARGSRLSALVAEGGNNDAAALDWMAEAALASGRRHQLLLMISDGRPTTSSEAALAARIAHWQGCGMVQVQLALRAIEPPIFPQQVPIIGVPERQAAARYAHLLASLVSSFSSSH